MSVLVLMQISIAGHQFAHVAEDINNTCQVCLQQDRLDDAPSVAILEHFIDDIVHAVETAVSVGYKPAAVIARAPRGPPRISA